MPQKNSMAELIKSKIVFTIIFISLNLHKIIVASLARLDSDYYFCWYFDYSMDREVHYSAHWHCYCQLRHRLSIDENKMELSEKKPSLGRSPELFSLFISRNITFAPDLQLHITDPFGAPSFIQRFVYPVQ